VTEHDPKENPEPIRMKAETGHFQMTGGGVTLTYRTIVEATKRRWGWIIVYAAVTVFGVVASYWTSKSISVALSLVVAIITFFVGLRMIQTVITITNERR
jgi:uncharacterized membrane protein YfcA